MTSPGASRAEGAKRARRLRALPDRHEAPQPLGDAAAGHNLPVVSSTFVGRGQAMEEVQKLLEGGRMVTLTGPTGIGKSRLAREVAIRVARGHADGAFLIELDTLDDPALVPKVVASALSVRDDADRQLIDRLIAQLRDRHLLIVLDNCEHLIHACAELCETLIAACPGVSILATSQERLAVTGERVWPVPPLTVPTEVGDSTTTDVLSGALMEHESVRLFCDRAAAVDPAFAMDSEVAGAVAEICRRLDGIPLAIELAAARTDMLSPPEIADRLDDRFGLLTSGRRTAHPRHQTLTNALEWSHELLSQTEQALLRRLAIFKGGFTLDAAERIGGWSGLADNDVLDVLAGLVAKSLVVSQSSGSHTRYRLLETVRHYARQRLVEAGEESVTQALHLEYYLALAEEAEPEVRGGRQHHWLERLEVEHDNVRAALERALSGASGQPEPGLRLAGAMAPFWRARGHFSEGRHWLETALAGDEDADPSWRAKALWGSGALAGMLGDFALAIARTRESLELSRRSGDQQASARALTVLGWATMLAGDTRSALPLLEESVKVAREAEDPWALADALAMSGQAQMYHGDSTKARSLFAECLEVARAGGDDHSMARGLIGLGWAALNEGSYRRAENYWRDALDVTRHLRDQIPTGEALSFLADVVRTRGRRGEARALLAECRQLAETTGSPILMARALGGLGRLALAEGDPTAARDHFDEAVAVARRAGATYILVRCLDGLGRACMALGEHRRARKLYEESNSLAEQAGDKHGVARSLQQLGALARIEDDLEEASSLFHQALTLFAEIPDRAGIAQSLRALAGVATLRGRYRAGARLCGAAASIFMSLSGPHARRPSGPVFSDPDTKLIKDHLGEEDFQAAWEEGAALSEREAIQYAAKGRGARGRPATGWASLTAAEREVVRLVQEGLTNPEIGERLFVSARTVGHHLSHVFAKLSIKSRRELAREASRRMEGS